MAFSPEQEAPGRVEPVKRAYESLAPSYDRRWRSYIEVSLAKVLSVLPLDGSERILDVACGTGELERKLFARWPDLRITGVDLCPKMLAQAREKHVGGDVTWIEGEASRLPVPDSRFDVVICANSFHYFRGPMDSLKEFHRCLAPNGKLILVDWCDDFWTCKLCSLWLRLIDPAFFRTYTLRAGRNMLVDAGFDVTHAERFKVSRLWGMMLFVCDGTTSARSCRSPGSTTGMESTQATVHGDFLSPPNSGSVVPALVGFVTSFKLEGAELGPQVPLSQVFAPKRGSTHT